MEEKKVSRLKFRDLERWQKKRFFLNFIIFIIVSTTFLATACFSLWKDKTSEDAYWQDGFQQSERVTEREAEVSGNATRVLVGSYIENFKQLDIKNSSYQVDLLVWFRWEGDKDLQLIDNFRIYKGNINKKEVVKDIYEDGIHYQLARVDATISKNFWTKRFPLESHQLRMYIETNYTVSDVILEPDIENSGVNKGLSVSGFKLVRNEVGAYGIEYDSTRSDPTVEGNVVSSEFVSALEINRDSWGLYVKCFIALLGTLSWVLITLYICTYHRVDPLGMIPGALFGTVANIMVGASLVPDALQLGLLEYVNIYSIFILLFATWTIININRIRNKYEDKDFAKYFGRIMFYTISGFTIIGHVVLPVTAYLYK